MLKNKQNSKDSVLTRALEFVHKREHIEGGFTLYEGIPDTKNTYYGVLTLKLLGTEPKNRNETIEWVEYLQRGRMFGLKGLFYRVNTLKILNRKPELHEKYLKKLKNREKFPSMEVAFMHVSILNALGYEDFDAVSRWIISHQNRDGGFGTIKSNVIQTYHAIKSLNLIDPSLIKFKDKIIDFINKCKTENGFYVHRPQSYPPYIETVYSGVMINQMLDNDVENVEKILEFVENLQNCDGGFRRSPYLGISELEYTFMSIYLLKYYSYFKDFSCFGK